MKHGLATMFLLAIGACACSPRANENGAVAVHSGGSMRSDHSRLHHYEPAADDVPWLAKAAEFHGHVGPWVVVGAMIGQDALARLGSRGQWEVEVVCWMPPHKQRPPFSCILDGLQSATGATMGKQNIRMLFDPEVVTVDQPVVHVFERGSDGRATRGYAYAVADRLAEILARSRPEWVELISREIAGYKPGDLFDIRALSPEDLSRLGLNRSASTGEAKTE